LFTWLVSQIKQRGVDKPLTADREELLRDAGATDEIIVAIRQNSPKLSGQIETPTPITVSSPVITTPTPTPTASTNPDPKKTFVLKTVKNTIGMEFVLIPAGTFTMGSPLTEVGRIDNEIPHKVAITRDFYMGRYEVTQGHWTAVMGSNPSYYSKCGENCPVDSVSWEDAQLFIEKLNAMGMGTYRLPTEAEWEYAARGGKENEPFGVGDGKNLSSELANFRGDYPYGEGQKGVSLEKSVPVGSYQPNDWGLFDMHGNVREWCADWYSDYITSNQVIKDPKGPVVGTERVYRGGGFTASGSYLRSAQRYRWTPTTRNASIGFRLVKVD
jgi:formylglycine-generating enzyme